MTTTTERCGTVRASLLYRAPIFSEMGACVLPKGHAGDHQDARGGTWYVIPLYPMVYTDREADQ
ncbi:hypothetical protein [Streptomyces sp. NBC_01538]|uniref:hypothetical protein n=1 Tax=Streptomyces sp. NBC_01538 TaxID=2903897 RepID=UPI003862DA08